jgi:hypothetical protein
VSASCLTLLCVWNCKAFMNKYKLAMCKHTSFFSSKLKVPVKSFNKMLRLGVWNEEEVEHIHDRKLFFVVIWSKNYWLKTSAICSFATAVNQTTLIPLVQCFQARSLCNGYFQMLFSHLSKFQNSMASWFTFYGAL